MAQLTTTQAGIVRTIRAGMLYRGEIAQRLAKVEGYTGPKESGHYLQKELDALVEAGVLRAVPGNAGRSYIVALVYDTPSKLDIKDPMALTGTIDAIIERVVSGADVALQGQEELQHAAQEETTMGTTQVQAPTSFSPVETLILEAMAGATEPLTKAQIGRLQPELKKKSGTSVKMAYERLLGHAVIEAVADGFVRIGAEPSGIVGRIVELVNNNGGAQDEVDAVKAAVKAMDDGAKAQTRAQVIQALNGKSAIGIFTCIGLIAAQKLEKVAQVAQAARETKKENAKARGTATQRSESMLQVTASTRVRIDSVLGVATLAAYRQHNVGDGTIAFGPIEAALVEGPCAELDKPKQRQYVGYGWRMMLVKGIATVQAEKASAPVKEQLYRLTAETVKLLEQQGAQPDGTIDRAVVVATAKADREKYDAEHAEDDETEG